MDLIDSALIADTLPAIAKDHIQRYLASQGRDGHLDVAETRRPPCATSPRCCW
jgi:hypothetical protein